MHISLDMRFNKSNSFKITVTSNCRWIQKSIEEINCKKRISWKGLFRQCKNLRGSFLMDKKDRQNQKFFITFLALDATSGNSVSVGHLDGVDSLREWSVLWKTDFIRKVKVRVKGIKSGTHRYRDNVKQQTRSVIYMDEDVQFPVLTPNLLILGQTPVVTNEYPTKIENKDLRKKQKYIQRCKEAACKRWKNEYVISSHERHKLKYKKRKLEVKVRETGNSCHKRRWIMQRFCSIVQNPVSNYHLVDSYTQQCHIGINVDHWYVTIIAIHVMLHFAFSHTELWMILISY